MGSKLLEFVPITSSINPSFWNKLSDIKLNVDKLNEVKHPIWGYFSNINNKCKVPILEVNSTSFNSDFDSQKIYIPFHGKILNQNTIEQFKDCDKTLIINDIGEKVIESIENGEALQTPSLLNQFFVLSFADLKKFHFYYWFAFPVLHSLSITCNSVKNILEDFSLNQLEDFWNKYCELDNNQKPYFLVCKDEGLFRVSELRHEIQNITKEKYETFYFGFYDLSLQDNCPGSTLRNYITLILHYCPFLQGMAVNFLSLRMKRNEDSILTITSSLIFNLELPDCQPSISDFIKKSPRNGWVGWEKNERGKMGPRLSNMKSFMDPKELAESSVDLNLKLMKWRLLSNIDLEIIKQTNFLLLGSGTLGCSVARILLGWGARNISFVDNSTVSYSNPVRQSLFTFEDSKNAKPKSLAAADNLRNIFPGVKSKSYQLTIPMPGHSVGESMLETVKKEVELLTSLIEEHDIIFLLMDSRESRWLPTLLGTYFDKTVINAALGFDSYLVMRHGVKVDQEEFKVRQHPKGFKSLKGNYLGCYFCNDVTAPGNSMKDRSLDQQCTVTRPGVSAIAGALSAELAISILQHKEGAKAPAFFQIGNVTNAEREIDNQCVLGLIPHTIRGYLSSFSQVQPATERYKLCVACSDIVQDAYSKDGFNFLLEAFQNSRYLEDITGLSQLTKEAEDIGVWEFSDEEEIQFTDYDEGNKSEAASSFSVEENRSKGEVLVQDYSYNAQEYSSEHNVESVTSKSNLNEQINADDVPPRTSNDSLGAKQSGEPEDMKNVLQIQKADISTDNPNKTRSFVNKIKEDFLEKLFSKSQTVSSNQDLIIKGQPFSNISSTDFINHVLSTDILPIVENKNIFSSGQSMIINKNETQKNQNDTEEVHTKESPTSGFTLPEDIPERHNESSNAFSQICSVSSKKSLSSEGFLSTPRTLRLQPTQGALKQPKTISTSSNSSMKPTSKPRLSLTKKDSMLKYPKSIATSSHSSIKINNTSDVKLSPTQEVLILKPPKSIPTSSNYSINIDTNLGLSLTQAPTGEILMLKQPKSLRATTDSSVSTTSKVKLSPTDEVSMLKQPNSNLTFSISSLENSTTSKPRLSSTQEVLLLKQPKSIPASSNSSMKISNTSKPILSPFQELSIPRQPKSNLTYLNSSMKLGTISKPRLSTPQELSILKQAKSNLTSSNSSMKMSTRSKPRLVSSQELSILKQPKSNLTSSYSSMKISTISKPRLSSSQELSLLKQPKPNLTSSNSSMKISTISKPRLSSSQELSLVRQPKSNLTSTNSSMKMSNTTKQRLSSIEELSILKQPESNLTSSNSSLKIPNTQISSENVNVQIVPKELLPILEKQKVIGGTRFGLLKQSTSKFKDQIISLKSKVKNFVSSVGLIRSTEGRYMRENTMLKEGSHTAQSPNSQYKVITLKSTACTLMSTDSSEATENEQRRSYCNKQHPEPTKNDKMKLKEHLFSHGINHSQNVLTLKSKIGNFVSSESFRSTESEHLASATSEGLNTSIQEKLKKREELLTILAKSMMSSSGTPSMDELCSGSEDKCHGNIVTLSKPHEIVTSSSSTSQNLGIDDSVYYLAETDSDKTIVNM